jgi:hypothetical protein
MKKKYLVSIALAFVTLLVLAGVSLAALTGEGLTISPPVSEPKIKPGQTLEQTIRVTNPTSKLIEVYPKVMDFKAKGESGQPAFYTAAESGDKFSLAKWVTYNPAKIALTPEQVIEYKYTIKVPADAEPGGHYGAIFFASEPPKDQAAGSKVTIGSMIGSLVLVRVPGDTIEKAIVEQFSTLKKTYIVGNKVNIVTRIANVGNVHVKPQGTIKIKDSFGNEKGTLTFNEQSGNVLPDSTRKFENNWTAKTADFGEFKASLNLTYGEASTPLKAEYTFWVLPVWVLGSSTILLIVFVLFILFIVSKFRGTDKSGRSRNEGRPTPTNQPPVLR